MSLPFRPVLLSLLSFLFSGTLFAAAADTASIRVGVAGTAPFFTEENTGIAVDIWDEVADNIDRRYTTTTFPNVPDALDALEAGKLDVVVGPVSITSGRAARMDLSQPWFRSSLSILSRTEGLSIWERIKPFFSVKLAYALAVFLFILAIVGTLLWLTERRTSPEQFPKDPFRGIGNGMWCAIVTMTTTGYGDIAPVTTAGRIVAGSWMIISLLSATTMIAGIASTLTLSGLDHTVIATADDLAGKRIAVLEDSPAAAFVAGHGGRPVPVADLEEGYEALAAKNVRAVVFDRPQLQYFLKTKHDPDMAVSPAQFQPQGYGFAFPLDSPLIHQVDVQLLLMKENGDLDRILKKWLGKSE